MKPITTAILAIDLGKYKCVACVLDPDSGEFRFTAFDTSLAELQKVIGKEQPGVIIIEACLLAGWVHDLCGELGVRCLVANTASEAIGAAPSTWPVADGDAAANRGAAMAFADRMSADVGRSACRGAESHPRVVRRSRAAGTAWRQGVEHDDRDRRQTPQLASSNAAQGDTHHGVVPGSRDLRAATGGSLPPLALRSPSSLFVWVRTGCASGSA